MFGPGRSSDVDRHSLEDGSAPDDVTFLSSPDSMLKMPKGICFYYSLMDSCFCVFFFSFLTRETIAVLERKEQPPQQK